MKPCGDEQMNHANIVFCGYRCDLCRVNSQNIDMLTDRTTLRNGMKTYFGFDVTEESLSYAGCRNKGHHLDTSCPVRPCCIGTRLENCSFCDLFDSCEKLHLCVDAVDEIRKNSMKNIQK